MGLPHVAAIPLVGFICLGVGTTAVIYQTGLLIVAVVMSDISAIIVIIAIKPESVEIMDDTISS